MDRTTSTTSALGVAGAPPDRQRPESQRPGPQRPDSRGPGPQRPDPLLDELLERELSWSPRAKGGYSSHFSMGLVAARRLGASDEWLRAHFEAGAADDFHVARERPTWLALDAARVERVGIGEEVRRRLPPMLDHLDAQYYHAVIRLELAIDADHPGQVANALHNWEASVDQAANLNAASPNPGSRDGQAVGVDTRTDPAAALADLSRLAAVAHVEAGNFGTLHLVTGTRAILAMLDHLEGAERERLARSAEHAVHSTMRDLEVHLGGAEAVAARAAELRGEPAPRWAEMGAAALADGDVHTIKLVYACRLQEERTGDALFAVTAARHLVG